MNCLWYATGSGNEKKCRRAGCTNRLCTDHPPEMCHAACQVMGLACRHNGKRELRRQGCGTCQGDVQVKVFACAVFGECTLAKQIDDIACCGGEGCGRFEPST